MSAEQSPAMQAVEAASAELDAADQACAQEADASGRVSEETALAYAAAFERYTRAVDAPPQEELDKLVPF